MPHNPDLLPRKNVYVAPLLDTGNIPEHIEFKMQSDCYSPEVFPYSLIGYANEPFVTTDGRVAERVPRKELKSAPFNPVPKLIRFAEELGYRLGSFIGRISQ